MVCIVDFPGVKSNEKSKFESDTSNLITSLELKAVLAIVKKN